MHAEEQHHGSMNQKTGFKCEGRVLRMPIDYDNSILCQGREPKLLMVLLSPLFPLSSP